MYLSVRQFSLLIVGVCSIGILLGYFMSYDKFRYTTVSEIVPPENGYDVFMKIMENCSSQQITSITRCTYDYKRLWVDTNAIYNYYVINRDTGERVLINE